MQDELCPFQMLHYCCWPALRCRPDISQKSPGRPLLPPAQHKQVHRDPPVVLPHSLLLPSLHRGHLLVYHHEHLDTIHDYLRPSPEVLSPAAAATSRGYLQVIQPSHNLPSIASAGPSASSQNLNLTPGPCLLATTPRTSAWTLPTALLCIAIFHSQYCVYVLGRQGVDAVAVQPVAHGQRPKQSQRSGSLPIIFGGLTNSMFSVVLSRIDVCRVDTSNMNLK